MTESQDTVIADTQTAVVNEFALRFDRFESRFDKFESRLESRIDNRFTWTLVALGLWVAVAGFLITVNGGDAAPTIHYIFTTPMPTATAIAEILPGR